MKLDNVSFAIGVISAVMLVLRRGNIDRKLLLKMLLDACEIIAEEMKLMFPRLFNNSLGNKHLLDVSGSTSNLNANRS